MKIICNFKSFAFTKRIINNKLISSYIISIKDYSLLTENVFTINEVSSIASYLKEHNKKVIVDIARLFHETEIDGLKEIIISLSNLNVDYFMYSDFGVYYLLKDLNLINKTMLYSNTYLTNTNDVLIYQEKNASLILSNQINSKELINIANNIKRPDVVSAFGRALIMYTRRPLLSNYFEYRRDKHNPKGMKYSLQEEFRDSFYPIVENYDSCKIYDFGYYYLLEELSSIPNSFDVIVSGELLTNDSYYKVLNIFTNLLNKSISHTDALSKLEKLNIPLHKGAYEKKLTLLKGGNNNE